MGHDDGDNPSAERPRSGASSAARTLGRWVLYVIVPGARIRAITAERKAETRRREALLAEGRSAKATILAATPTRSKTRSDGDAKRIWELTLQVQPADGNAFDVTVRHGFTSSDTPAVDGVVDVLYDPADHTRAIVAPT